MSRGSRKSPDISQEDWKSVEPPEATAAEFAAARPFKEVFPEQYKTRGQPLKTPKNTIPSATYRLFERAMEEGKQIVCEYEGHRREICPIILGHSDGEEKALTFQFAGTSGRGLPPGGDWRCLWLFKVRDVELRGGPLFRGDSHKQPSGCVKEVDLDINPESPYNPKRRLKAQAP